MATAPAAVSANKAELIAIADSVAREKLIDKGIVIEAMEDDFIARIERAVREVAFGFMTKELKIVRAALGDDAGSLDSKV